ncbi:acyl-CoA thioesterase [Kineococcus rhizosphaerae]|uniref:Acyl-CoA thioester hydrolase n=1 Tax=Kineococcus rhizosphaerae TaxID=559628 RepID=A0A2T0R6P0_9ACTN|nr:thioesterase family protein [Kineococcus rhizosphaerae]PRY16813.1 acyl-CoA thioester hydrolase [Kineococcus rhizosphaerae]
MARTRLLLSLRWGDMDAYRHVNNVELLRLLEEARVRAFGIAAPDGSAPMLATGMVVAKHTVEYLRPLDYRLAPIAVDLWVGRVGGASFEVDYEVVEPDEASAVYVKASTVCVAYDFDAARPRRLGEDERARLAGLAG